MVGTSNSNTEERLAATEMKVDGELSKLASFYVLQSGNGEQHTFEGVNVQDKDLMDKQLTPNGVVDNSQEEQR